MTSITYTRFFKNKSFNFSIIIISITNLIFLKNWIYLGIFNYKNNYFSLGGIDKKFFFFEISLFLFFAVLSIFFFKFLKKKSETILFLFQVIYIFLAINSIRSVSNLDFLSFVNNSFFFIIFLLLVFFFIFFTFKKKYLQYFDKAFKLLGLIFFPFFLIIFFHLCFGLIYLKQYDGQNFENKIYINNNLNYENKKNRIIWIIFDQFDSKILEKNLNNFPSIKYLISKSDIYTNYNPGSFETIRAIPPIINRLESNEEYFFKFNKRNIDLYLGNGKKVEKISVDNSVFQKSQNKGYSNYINSWYIPTCRIYNNFYDKCFQVAYGENLTFKYFNLKELLLLNLYNIIPTIDKLSYKIFKDNLFFEKIEINSQAFNWYLNSHAKQYKDFMEEIDNFNASFVYYHAIIPHPPIIYNHKNKKLFKTYKEMKMYLKQQNIKNNPLNYNLDNFFLVELLLKELIKNLTDKKLFDNTTIIIHGDTGLSESLKNLDTHQLISTTPVIIKNKFQNKQKIIKKFIGPENLHDLIIKKL